MAKERQSAHDADPGLGEVKLAHKALAQRWVRAMTGIGDQVLC
jgi:hypothetical protein